jgi:hypothetical protein
VLESADRAVVPRRVVPVDVKGRNDERPDKKEDCGNRRTRAKHPMAFRRHQLNGTRFERVCQHAWLTANEGGLSPRLEV